MRVRGTALRAHWRALVEGVAKVFERIVDAHRIEELAGIHAVVRIPERLEFAEGLHELGAEHFGQQRGARLAVAVLAGERAAKARTRSAARSMNSRKMRMPCCAAEIEIDAHVDAALAVVAVERAAIAVLGHELGDGAKICAQLLGGNGSILPTFPAVGLAGHKDHGTERGFAHMPHRLSLVGARRYVPRAAKATTATRAPVTRLWRGLLQRTMRPSRPAEIQCPGEACQGRAEPDLCGA